MPVTVLDAHVHFYPQFDESEFLQSALSNFARLNLLATTETQSRGTGAMLEGAGGVLCLTESQRCQWFSELRDASALGDWQVLSTKEPCAKILQSPAGERLVVIAGRQVISSERLEVLVLGTTDTPADGQPATEIIDAALAAEQLVILPWGFGKWWFSRGRVVSALMQAYGAKICLGDNGGRAALLPRPRLLRQGERLGLKTLSGSDPLPLAGEAQNVARLGNFLDSAVDLEQPFTWLRNQLRQQTPTECGRRESLWRFGKNQLLMQLHKQR